MQAVVDQLLTQYQRSGTGQQILILHGWGDSAAGWAQFAKQLAKRYEVIVPDLPGFGASQMPPAAWGIDDYAAFVAAFLAKIGIKPYAILGHSNGGAISIRGTASGILSADRLVLLASAGIRGEYKGRNKALRMVTKTGKLLAKPLPARVQKKLQKKVYQTVGSDMLVVEALQETFKKVVTDDVRVDAAKISQPTLLVYGEQDDQAPPSYGRLFHEVMDDSTLEILAGADHFLHISNQTEVLKLVEDFLQ